MTWQPGFGLRGDPFVTVLLLSSDANVGATCNYPGKKKILRKGCED